MAILFLCTAALLSADTNWPAALESAQRTYNLSAAENVRQGLANAADTNPDEAIQALYAESLLTIAELHRIDFERLHSSNLADRRALGAKIDDAAESGIAILDKLLPTSERLRMRADLRATLIRSDFRARTHRKQMEQDAASALKLDPENAKAYVTQSKPYLFAESYEGGDLNQGIDLLDEALAIDPKLESALCLRAFAFDKRGDTASARRDYEQALANNPDCRPAREELARLDAL